MNQYFRKLSFQSPAVIAILLFSGSVLCVHPQVSGLRILSSAGRTRSISQYGITWNFEQVVEYGQFVNGDYWVVGPVTVASVTPATTRIGGRTANGSMLSPASEFQGFDSLCDRYSSSLTLSFPVRIPAETSLLSAKSHMTEGSIVDYTGYGPIPWSHAGKLETVAVLTVLAQPPPVGAFRPPFFGTDKRLYLSSSVNWNRLPRLRPQHIMNSGYDFEDIYNRNKSWGTVADNYMRIFQRPWSGLTAPDFTSRFNNPTQNTPNYHREISSYHSDMALLLCLDLDHKYGRSGELEKLVIVYVQLGIDMHHIMQRVQGCAGKNRWPALFAGIMLGDATLQNGHNSWIESDFMGRHPYYRNEATATTVSAIVPPGSFHHGYAIGFREGMGNQEHEHLHPSEWPSKVINWDTREAYRGLKSPGFVGIGLSAHIFGLRAGQMGGGQPHAVNLFNKPQLFDYVKRWMDNENQNASSGFAENMWSLYKW